MPSDVCAPPAPPRPPRPAPLPQAKDAYDAQELIRKERITQALASMHHLHNPSVDWERVMAKVAAEEARLAVVEGRQPPAAAAAGAAAAATGVQHR